LSADDILKIDANAVLSKLHLKEHLTPQRSNGLLSMVERIRSDARGALATQAAH
jgi:cysteine desulfuration protein SufE